MGLEQAENAFMSFLPDDFLCPPGQPDGAGSCAPFQDFGIAAGCKKPIDIGCRGHVPPRAIERDHAFRIVDRQQRGCPARDAFGSLLACRFTEPLPDPQIGVAMHFSDVCILDCVQRTAPFPQELSGLC